MGVLCGRLRRSSHANRGSAREHVYPALDLRRWEIPSAVIREWGVGE